jgi:hypothetical protein
MLVQMQNRGKQMAKSTQSQVAMMRQDREQVRSQFNEAKENYLLLQQREARECSGRTVSAATTVGLGWFDLKAGALQMRPSSCATRSSRSRCATCLLCPALPKQVARHGPAHARRSLATLCYSETQLKAISSRSWRSSRGCTRG